ncbi:hypothetical protein kpv767_13 [Klebsiella phage vB_KpnP_KpV767]|uniref:Nucleotide kinase n=1 Tax=Klebsiella phage vB_KpnP_KpV767 TaxID=1897430 RepID=A0A1I9SF56_9CAUD|nr:nucleotide kinase [Klebsiella phage vB_KpnP_KpV767]AOZ65486.1 hypothetical protein kpv767_13 [Klebsiella phage vB_KpnP_KpV767]
MTDKEMLAVYKIVDQNADRPDLTSELLVYCAGVACEDCPMQKVGTLGEVRAMDDRNVTKVKEPAEPKEDDGVKQPSHYQLFEGVEVIEVIARSMTKEMFKGYCLGNILKYRLRAGKKSELATLEKDMAKATFYLELYAKYKGSCHD